MLNECGLFGVEVARQMDKRILGNVEEFEMH